MPATIARGITFGSSDSVTNVKLHTLVENATITDIDETNMASGRGLVIRSTSAPSNTDSIWVDTNCSPPVARIYDGTEWVATGSYAVLTNKSGSTRSAGDVVIVDSSNAGAFTTTTTSGSPAGPMVVMESIANNADGVVALAGSRVTNIAVDGTTTKGQFLKTSSTAGKATPVTSPAQGVFAIALDARTGSGVLAEALLIGVTVHSANATPKGYMYGCLPFNSISDLTNDLTVSAGVARDDTNTYDIVLASNMQKQGDATFAAGTNAGGGNITGSAGKRYVYLIGKSTDSSAADVLFSASAPGAVSLPSGWDIKRLIGVRYWTGSKWAPISETSSNGVRIITFLDSYAVGTGLTTSSFTDIDISNYLDASYCRNVKIGAATTSGTGSCVLHIRPNGSTEAVGDGNKFFAETNAADNIQGAAWGYIAIDENAIFEYNVQNGTWSIYLKGYIEEL